MLSSTGDEVMANETNALCERLVEHLRKENG
jgi:predicted small metal-binding protein